MPVNLRKGEKMKTKLGIQALSLLLVLALTGAIFIPAVSAEELTSDDIESIPLINIEDSTNLISGEQVKSELKIQSTIEKYDLVLFDIPQIREQLAKNKELPVEILGKQYSMILDEIAVNDVGVNPNTYSYTGYLKGAKESEIVLTISESTLIARITLDGDELYIESSSSKDPSDNYYHYEYMLKDVKEEGGPLYLKDDYLAHKDMTDQEIQERNAIAQIEEEKLATKSTTYVRILVMTDAKWIYDEPDWMTKAQNIIAEANNQLGRYDIETCLLATYDSSKASELAADSQNLIQDSLGTFKNHVPESYLDSNSADLVIYLGGYDCTNPNAGVGATWGYDNSDPTLRRYGWVQMADDPSLYDAIHHDRAVITLHEIGHMFDADHQDGFEGPNQESYNRAYQWNSGSTTTQSVVWAVMLKSTSYEYSSYDFNGDYYHNNALRIFQTRNVVASYV